MAFKTYQCEKYHAYLVAHQDTVKNIYKLIESAPYTKTQLGEVIGLKFHAYFRRFKARTLTYQDLMKLLEFIK